MRLTRVHVLARSIAASTGMMIFAGCGTVPTAKPIEFWHVGDDAASQKLAVAVEKALTRSSDFRLTSTGPGGRLVVWITDNAGSEQVGERIKTTYSVQYAWLSKDLAKNPDPDQRVALAKEISRQRGSCWADKLDTCAEQIVSYARIAARKAPSP